MTTAVQTIDNDDSFLDDLLAESVQAADDLKKLKDARRNAKLGRSPDTPQEELRRIEAMHEWKAVADVAMFQIQHCACCDNYLASFTGIFQRQSHRHNRNTFRWLASTSSHNRGLPKEVKTQEIDVPFCNFCLAENGYPAEQLGIVFDEEPEATDDDTLTPEEAAQLEFEAQQDAIAESLQLPISEAPANWVEVV